MSEKKHEKQEEKVEKEEVKEQSAKVDEEEPVAEEIEGQKEVREENKENKEIEELKKQVAEYKDKWMRNVAEFDNFKKRNAKIWQEAYSEGISSVVKKILPVGDSLDRALELGLDEKTQAGILAIRRKFDEMLKNMEIEEINPVGETFDPNIAEAVMQVEGGEGDKGETVKQVFEKGYKLKEKVIRYAKVSVIK